MFSTTKNTIKNLVTNLDKMSNTNCPYCKSSNIIKKGNSQSKIGQKQIFKCKDCKRRFKDYFIPNKHYTLKLIFKAISLYNQGNTIKQSQKIIAKQHNKSIPISTIHSWLKTSQSLCTFTSLRKKLKLNPQNIIQTHLFNHHQPYLMQYHTTKLKFTNNNNIRDYLNYITNYTIDISKLIQCSEASEKYNKEQTTVPTQIPAQEFAKIAIDISENNSQRHQKLQNLMLTNDRETIVTELPIFSNKYIGHIDILQYQNHQFQILEYKPIINKSAFNQARLYKYLFANNLKLHFKEIQAFVFNENECYEIK
jgi:transposase-like protein